MAKDGTIFFGASGGIYALSPDGKLLWQTPLAAPGPPVVAQDGSIYVALSHGLLFGYSSDGKLTWQPGVGMTAFATPPALGMDNTLYVINSPADVFAFKPPRTGIFEWNRRSFGQNVPANASPLPANGRGNARSAPVIERDQSVLVPRLSWLHSFSPDGNDHWVAELTPSSLGQPALGEDGTIYVCDEASLFAVDVAGGKKWNFGEACSLPWSPVLDAQGVIYFSAGDFLYAVNPDGSRKWKVSGFGHGYGNALRTAPVLAEDGTIYVGAERYLFAIRNDGTVKWELRVMTPTSAASIGQDGTIYFACGYSSMCAVSDSGSPLMHSSWPKQFHDSANTSNALTPLP